MNRRMQYTINVGGDLLDLSEPRVMGILNVTSDSFFTDSRKQTEPGIIDRTRQILQEGGAIVDVGACSTRPGAEPVSQTEEMERLRMALGAIRREDPECILSVDTFRADVAKMCVQEFGAQIINDVSGGQDPEMFATAAQLHVPYILTHTRGDAQTMQQLAQYEDLMVEMLQYFAQRIHQLHELGVSDIILDPGFGFAKTLAHNYELMSRLQDLLVLELPLLVGVSRKSMVSQLLHCTPQEALNGTTVLHTIALEKGASILRVHDVKEAVEAVRITKELHP